MIHTTTSNVGLKHTSVDHTAEDLWCVFFITRSEQGLIYRHLADIPPEDAIIEAGREILESSLTWKQGKTYEKNTVKTLYRAKGPKDGASWYGRISEHRKEDGTFEEFWNKIGVNKTENEKEYVPMRRSSRT